MPKFFESGRPIKVSMKLPITEAEQMWEQAKEYRKLKEAVGAVLCQPHPHIIQLHAETNDDKSFNGEIGVTVLRMKGEQPTWEDYQEAVCNGTLEMEAIIHVGIGTFGLQSIHMTLEEFFYLFHPDYQEERDRDEGEFLSRITSNIS